MARYKTEADLRQADFSRRRISELSDAEKQELNRRFNEFVRAMKGQLPGTPGGEEQDEKPAPKVKKWVPGAPGRR